LEEAADYMATSDKYLRGIIQRGEIPVLRMGKGPNAPWVIEVSDIHAWADRHKETLG
jgi:excisionase family DNA binding protein